MPVKIDGKNARLTSIYVPDKPKERMVFLKALRANKQVRKGDIIGGDFNCVPVTSEDARTIEGGGAYANTHGALCESIMTEKGLTDVFRLFHGESARQYTRLGDTVHTRLDRLYAKRYDSDWRWTAYSHDYASFGRSDHAAVIAELETAPKRDSTKKEQRIDPTIMRDDEVRRTVEQLWKQAYKERPPERFTHAKSWTYARKIVAQYLLCQTEEKRHKMKSRSELAEQNLQHICEQPFSACCTWPRPH